MTREEIARQYYQLFNAREFDAAAQLVDREASIRYIPSKQRLIGRAGYRALVAMWLNAFEDGQLEILSITPKDGEVVVVDILGRGTHTGDLVFGETVTIPATGVAGSLRFKETLRIQNGRITELELDFDLDDLKRQLQG